MKNKVLYLLGICLYFQLAQAQVEKPAKQNSIGFNEYLNLVASHNLGYAAEKYNVDISFAAIEAAKVFQNPSFSFEWTDNREDGQRTEYGFTSELEQTIELGGKRRARIELAKSENQLMKALVRDYYRNLQADAALVYLEAVKQNHLFQVSLDSYKTIKQLADADSLRFQLGSIMEIDAAQSRVEAGMIFNELLHSEAEWKNSLTQLAFMTGVPKNDTIYIPTGKLNIPIRLFNLNELIILGQNNRADLLAALKNKDVSQKQLTLTYKERIMDISLKAGIENSYLYPGGAPNAKVLVAGLAIPLNFSNFNKGEIQIAQLRISQAEDQYKSAELQVRREIIQALELYGAYCKQVESFDKGLLENAKSVKKGKIYSYERGETSLLEVLNAQRTYNEIQTAYYEALFNRAVALVELEKAVGIWDIVL